MRRRVFYSTLTQPFSQRAREKSHCEEQSDEAIQPFKHVMSEKRRVKSLTIMSILVGLVCPTDIIALIILTSFLLSAFVSY